MIGGDTIASCSVRFMKDFSAKTSRSQSSGTDARMLRGNGGGFKRGRIPLDLSRC